MQDFLLDYSWPSGRVFRKNPDSIKDYPQLFEKNSHAEVDFLNSHIKDYMKDKIKELSARNFFLDKEIGHKEIKFIQVPTVFWDIYTLKELLKLENSNELPWDTDEIKKIIDVKFVAALAQELVQEESLSLELLLNKVENYLKEMNDIYISLQKKRINDNIFKVAPLIKEYERIKEKSGSILVKALEAEFKAQEENQGFYIRGTRGVQVGGPRKVILDFVINPNLNGIDGKKYDEGILSQLQDETLFPGIRQTKNISYAYSILNGYLLDGYRDSKTSWSACTMTYFSTSMGSLRKDTIVYTLTTDKKQSYSSSHWMLDPVVLLTDGITGSGEYFHPRIKNIMMNPKTNFDMGLSIKAQDLISSDKFNYDSPLFKNIFESLKPEIITPEEENKTKARITGLYTGAIEISEALANNTTILSFQGQFLDKTLPIRWAESTLVNQKEAYERLKKLFLKPSE